MINPTYGKPVVAPDDIVARIDALIPRGADGTPLAWVARSVSTETLLKVAAEIERLRARVDALEFHLRKMIEFDGTWNEVHAAVDAARAALEAKPCPR